MLVAARAKTYNGGWRIGTGDVQSVGDTQPGKSWLHGCSETKEQLKQSY
jgi:hypothetical protein